jgi:hypothetical protein
LRSTIRLGNGTNEDDQELLDSATLSSEEDATNTALQGEIHYSKIPKGKEEGKDTCTKATNHPGANCKDRSKARET